MLGFINTITTGTLIACIFWYGLVRLEDGEPLMEASVSYLVLPEILLLGTLCGVETELLLPEREMTLREERLRTVIHFTLITATVLVCGHFFDWYSLTFSGVLLMCLTTALIYLFTCFVNYWKQKKETDKMNEHLKKYRNEER